MQNTNDYAAGYNLQKILNEYYVSSMGTYTSMQNTNDYAAGYNLQKILNEYYVSSMGTDSSNYYFVISISNILI